MTTQNVKGRVTFVAMELSALPPHIESAVYAAAHPLYPACQFLGEVDAEYSSAVNFAKTNKLQSPDDKRFCENVQACVDAIHWEYGTARSTDPEIICERRRNVLRVMSLFEAQATAAQRAAWQQDHRDIVQVQIIQVQHPW